MVSDEALDDDAVGRRGGRHGGAGAGDEPEVVERVVDEAARNERGEVERLRGGGGRDGGLEREAVQREEVVEAARAEERGEDGGAGEGRGSAVGVERVAGEERRLGDVGLGSREEREDPVVEREAGRRQRGERLREAHDPRGRRGGGGRRDERVPASLPAGGRGRGDVRVREREERRHEAARRERLRQRHLLPSVVGRRRRAGREGFGPCV